jgi:hypothetical protein
MASSIKSTKPSLIEKVKSLGATFFSKYTTTKNMNKWIDKTSNQVGLIEYVSPGGTSTTDVCFQNLEVGDILFMMKTGASSYDAGVCAVTATCPFSVTAGVHILVIRPGKTII